jgi:hypothetical protein
MLLDQITVLKSMAYQESPMKHWMTRWPVGFWPRALISRLATSRRLRSNERVGGAERLPRRHLETWLNEDPPAIPPLRRHSKTSDHGP